MDQTKKNYDLQHLLRDMRKNHKKTIEQVAEEIGVSRQTVSNWESGKSSPDAYSFLALTKAYDPSLDQVKRMFNHDSPIENHEKDNIRLTVEDAKETADEYFKEIGHVSFEISDFLKDVAERYTSNYKWPEKNEDGSLPFIPLWLVGMTLDFDKENNLPFVMATLAIRLKKKGYLVNYIDGENGYVNMFILNEEQRKHLGSFILEHLLMKECRLSDFSVTEQHYIKEIQSEYDEINKRLKKLLDEKITPLIEDNALDLYSKNEEYTLFIGVKSKDGEIYCGFDEKVYTAGTLKEMADFIEKNEEMIATLADYNNSFLVIGDNGIDEFSFKPDCEPKELSKEVRIYRVDCSDDGSDNDAESNGSQNE